MTKKGKLCLWTGVLLLVLFAVWTLLIQRVDVRPAGQAGTEIGFAAWNIRFHEVCGVHMWLYTVTDWLGLVPLAVCMLFGCIGFAQLLQRKALRKVDLDIIFLGVYYVLVILGYLLFEMFPVNYRPILLDGRMEASYPSSTTLLVLSVMPTLAFQIRRRVKKPTAKKLLTRLTVLFSMFMVIGRLLSGVHWFTDIVGAVLLSAGLFCMYRAAVLLYSREAY